MIQASVDPAPSLRRCGRARAEEFSWERVTAKVEAYYGFVIRRLAAQRALPEGFHAVVPPGPPRVAAGLDGDDGVDGDGIGTRVTDPGADPGARAGAHAG